MAYTGGELNLLNGKYGISAPSNSVPVMKLIKAHQPKTRAELYSLIQSHAEFKCPCGVISQGRVEDFGRQLYDAQLKEWGIYKYSLQECIQWEYDLFVTQSLKGDLIERNAQQSLQTVLKILALKVELAEGFVDEELRVDLLIQKEEQIICGIQVKPLTFKKMRAGVIWQNKKANKKWGRPVYYLFYDKNEKFKNMDEIIESIIGLMPDMS
ncbi:MAG: hypothetical protein AAFZ15_29165 [Bacteroidota bacterium]